MHHLLDVFKAILDFLSIPFPLWRRKGEKLSQTEEAHRAVLLIIFGALVVFGSIIWLANFLGHR